MPATAQAIRSGAPTRIPHPAIRVRQATPAEETVEVATGEAVAMVAAEAINNPPLGPAGQADVTDILDSFQSGRGTSLESLEKTLFPFASCRSLKYRWALAPLMGSPFR